MLALAIQLRRADAVALGDLHGVVFGGDQVEHEPAGVQRVADGVAGFCREPVQGQIARHFFALHRDGEGADIALIRYGDGLRALLHQQHRGAFEPLADVPVAGADIGADGQACGIQHLAHGVGGAVGEGEHADTVDTLLRLLYRDLEAAGLPGVAQLDGLRARGVEQGGVDLIAGGDELGAAAGVDELQLQAVGIQRIAHVVCGFVRQAHDAQTGGAHFAHGDEDRWGDDGDLKAVVVVGDHAVVIGGADIVGTGLVDGFVGAGDQAALGAAVAGVPLIAQLAAVGDGGGHTHVDHVVERAADAGPDDQLGLGGFHVDAAHEAVLGVHIEHRVIVAGNRGDPAQIDLGRINVVVQNKVHAGGQTARGHGDRAARFHAGGQMVERLPNLQRRRIRVGHVRKGGGTDIQQQEQDHRR